MRSPRLAPLALAAIAGLPILGCDHPAEPPPDGPADPTALVQRLELAYQRRDYAAFARLLSRPEDSAPYVFYPNVPLPDSTAEWGLAEELRIHRRMFRPVDPLPDETPVPEELQLASIEVELVSQGGFSTERPDLYRSDANPDGLDPARWHATDCVYTTYVFFELRGEIDYLVTGRANFVVIEDKTKRPGDDRRFLLYRWEDLGSRDLATCDLVGRHLTSRNPASGDPGLAAVMPATWSHLKGLYRR